jgi:hypothetical protein
MPDAVTASFGGNQTIRGFDFTFNRGITPSVCTLYCAPQDGLDATGPLTFALGNQSVTFNNCTVAGAFVRRPYDSKWPLWSVQVVDRRWRWKFSQVSGDYNRRGADGIIDNTTRKTPGELARLLLQAMGESNINVSSMPTNVFPRALWNAQRADLTLQALCDYVACEVVYNYQTDGVEIWPLGVGGSLPDGQSKFRSACRFAPRSNIPSIVEVRGGPSVYQSKLKLSAVARNYTDGKQKLIDSVEYKPSTGWSTESPFSFPSSTDNTRRALMFDQVWREYKVVGQESGSLTVPNCQASIASVDQYHLLDTLLDYETDLDGYKRPIPCVIDGDFYAYTDLPNNTSAQRYAGDFALNKERRIVKFPYPVFKLSSSGAYAEPTLNLTTAYKVQDTNREFVGVVRTGNIGGSGGKLVLKRPEVFATYSSSTLPGAQASTESQATTELDAYGNLFLRKYQDQTAAEISHAGFFAGLLDGKICQITWSCLPMIGASTMFCINEELDTGSVGRLERRRREQLAQLVEAQ